MQKSKLRIIAGQFRGRKIFFNPSNNELRPTLNIVRETLFNWLATDIVGANCLDLFSGSGIFSFEALSRGANYSLAIEKNLFAYQDILQNKIKLNIEEQKFSILNQDVLPLLQNSAFLSKILSNITISGTPTLGKKFNLIFLDPPYDRSGDLLLDCLNILNNNNLIDNNNKIYFECEEKDFLLCNKEKLSTNLQLMKSSKAGKVYFYLVTINFNNL